tara:strand:+ start:115 stop:354 length:240 start_codon:yes stop_codon:yes gene_type:complete
MIEQLIYFVGVTVILSFGILSIVCIIYLIAYVTKNLLVTKLLNMYEHAQLLYFMRQIIKKGYVKAMKDVQSNSPQKIEE